MNEKYDRKAHLQSLHKSRKAATQGKADGAILRLTKAGQAVNFNSVAKESGLSKATLYNNAEIRESIENLRQRQATVLPRGQLERELQEESKDAIIASLKRKIRTLQEENTRLKEQLKINYGDLYKKL
ncbi:MAG: DUF6262 family protein [Ethanoligenens sp.]|uniref:DUF6262 family protein n=1 Tax=Ethanoligenens sp. TaxID=2099655 RepID=UPI0039E94DC3